MIPFAALSTGSLFLTEKAHAMEILGVEPAKVKNVFDKLGFILDKVTDGITYVAHMFANPVEFLTKIYEILSKVVLTTPTIIFNNSYIQNTSLTFAIISVSLVTILTVYESIMQVMKKKHTKFDVIIKRYFTASVATGFAPFLFEKTFSLLNHLTTTITKMGSGMAGANYSVVQQSMSGIDLFILFGFDVVLVGMLFPLLLQNGRRWWDLMCLAAVSPLVGVAYVFDRHQHYATAWWNSVKKLSLIQLVYAVFILLLGVFIFGTRSLTSGWDLIFKLLIVAGGMWRMLNPPRIVQSMVAGDSKDVFDIYDDYKGGFRDLKDTLTLKKFRPAVFMRKQKQERQSREEQIRALRKKHGVRSVKKFIK